MLCFVFAALVVLLDQFFKRWIVITLASGGETVILPGILNLIYVENSGAAFSILPNQRWLLAGIAFIAALVLIAILLRYNEGFWGTLGLASVLGGTVGNLIDRVFHGYVVDMFRTTFMNFAIFNIADIFIILGGFTFCVFFLVSSFRSGNDEESPASASDEYIEEHYDVYDYPEEQIEVRQPEPREEIDYTKLFYEDTVSSGLSESDYAPPPEYFTSEQEIPDYYESASEQPDYYEPEPARQVYSEPEPARQVYTEPEPAAASSTLEALGTLESELTDLLEDYDLDGILREYGFEEDKD